MRPLKNGLGKKVRRPKQIFNRGNLLVLRIKNLREGSNLKTNPFHCRHFFLFQRSQDIKQVLLGVSVWHYCMKLCRRELGFHVQLGLMVWAVFQKTVAML